MRVTGIDPNGEKLEGNNDSFKVKIPIANLPDDLDGASAELLRHFEGLKKNKIITVPDTDATTIQKAKDARRALKP